jgi:hypothetical protein
VAILPILLILLQVPDYLIMDPQSRQRPAEDSIDQIDREDVSESAAELQRGAVVREAAVAVESDENPLEEAHRTDAWNEFAADRLPCEDAVGSPQSGAPEQNSLASVVESSSELLNRLILQFNDLTALVSTVSTTDAGHAGHTEADSLRRQVAKLEEQVAGLQQQNNDLASQLDRSNNEQPVSSASTSSNESLSWEARKELILQQMEDESFDAEAFIETLTPDKTDECDPLTYVQQLHEEIEGLEAEIQELQCFREQQSQPSLVAEPAAAVDAADMSDGDELLRHERAKLKELQAECETRIRESEIAASLERAKLSRERRELARKSAELEEQLTQLRREAEESSQSGATGSRRWLAKLGLQDTGRDK